MHTEKYINLDELTKDNLLIVLRQLIHALEFASKKFIICLETSFTGVLE